MSWRDHPLHCVCEECASPDPTYAGTRGAARGLIERLTRRGVSFRVAGDRVRFFPKDGVEGEDLEELRRVKADLITLLSADEARQRLGEGNVRDELEAFDLAREFFDNEAGGNRGAA
jgi:hypothetical protein